MIISIITAFLLGVPATYVLRALFLERKDGHEGPFRSDTYDVYFPERESKDGVIQLEHYQPVSLFDRIRRVFGAYKIEGGRWIVLEGGAADRFTCAYCLSFWTAFLFSVPFTLIDQNYLLFPVYHFGIAIVSLFIYRQLF